VTLLPVTPTSHPWLAQAPLAGGYVEEEYQFSGTAALYAYAGAGPRQWDITLQDQQPYTSRMIVRRPSDPQKFNGAVVWAF
jgi:Alpha/beta hydrolase domain